MGVYMGKFTVIGIVVAVIVVVIAGLIYWYYSMSGISQPAFTATPTNVTSTPSSTTSIQTVSQVNKSKGIVLVVLTRHPITVQKLARELFLKSDIAKKYHIVDVKFVHIPTSLWLKYIESSHPDVAWGGGPVIFNFLYSKHLLAPLTSKAVLDALKQIPSRIAGVPTMLKGSDGKVYWVGAAISSFGFTVNTKVLKEYGLPMPNKWGDLATPTMGKALLEVGKPALGIADPTHSSSITTMYEIILQRFGWNEGWKYLTLMGANAVIYTHSSQVRDAVIRGDVAVGLTIDFYGYTAMVMNKYCKYVIPEDGSLVNPDPIALLKSSLHPEAAQAFIAWVLTEGQQIWLNKQVNRLPINPNAFNTPLGKERKDLKEVFDKVMRYHGINFNESLAMSYQTAMQYYFKATIIDAHNYLVQAWKELLKKYFEGKISKNRFEELVNKLTAPVKFIDPVTGKKVEFTQQYAQFIEKYIVNNATIRSKLIDEWRKAAIEKYQEVMQELGEG